MQVPAKWRRSAAGVTALAMAAYLAVALSAQGGQILESITHIGAGTVALVLLLSLFNYGLRFTRWQLYLGWRGFEVPVLRSLLIYLAGFALTVSPGKAGEGVRCLYLNHEGVPYKASVALLFVERLLDFFAIVVLAAFVLWGRADLAWTIAIPLVFAVTALFLVTRERSPAFLMRAGQRLGGRPGRMIEWTADTLEHSRQLLTWKRLAVSLVLSVIAWGAEGYGVWLLASAIGHDLGVGPAIGIYGLAILAGAMAVFVPAGLGGTETVMTGALAAAGLPLASAIAITLVCRLATLWFAVALGVAALTLVELKLAPATRPATLEGLEGAHE
ncbi:lysylphosphatidylglycerol synthase transmembrane domain-containing protein [Parvibaculum sp.]|uniref:lysylphosphatidylglycerol synthase transmembrane domain-containing protein n=1 Tax=Parvibaculum sp. TaxID=2024848 RepID=UPI00320E1B4A